MKKILRFLRPMAGVAVVVGLGKIFWTWVGQPQVLIDIHSLGILSFAGSLYLTLQVASDPTLRIRHLWLGNVLFFAFCQVVDTVHWTYMALRVHPALISKAGGATFQVMQAPMVQQLWLQLVTWGLIAPTIVTFVSGAPVILLRRYADRVAE